MSSSPYRFNRLKRFYHWCKGHCLFLLQQMRLEPRKAIIYGILIFALISSMTFAEYFKIRSSDRAQELASIPVMTIQDLQTAINKNQIVSLTNASALSGGWLGQEYKFYIVVKLKNGQTKAVEQIDPSRSDQWKTLTSEAQDHNFKILQGYNAFEQIPVMGLINFALTMVFFLIVFVLAQTIIGDIISGFKFKPDNPDTLVQMDDIAGYDVVKRQFQEVLDQLKNKEYFESQHISPPRGILLTGDPGVGKTMFAKAIASSMQAQFFTCTGADFVEMYVGVGPKRVRSLFRQARKTKNAVIFIDEIDALGSREQMNMDSERQATINSMLAELDGTNGKGNLLVIGATNYPDKLDTALRRAGRFDRIIHLPLPDLKTREGIFEKYLKKINVSSDINIQSLALRTQAYSGAQIKQVVDEAKQLALRESISNNQKLLLTQEHLEQGQEIAMMGIFEKESEGPEAQRAAIHELGHALIGYLCQPNQKVEKVTLKGRGHALAYVFSRPISESHLQTKEELLGQIATLLGGRAAEEVLLKSISSGASNDLTQANRIAEHMVCFLGMGEKLGLRAFDPHLPPNQRPADVELDIRQIIHEQYVRVCALIQEHQAWIETKTKELFEHKILGHEALFKDFKRTIQ